MSTVRTLIRRLAAGRSAAPPNLMTPVNVPENAVADAGPGTAPPTRVPEHSAAAPPRPDRAYHGPRGRPAQADERG